MVRNKYNFKQSELYTIARLVLSFLTVPQVLTRFSAFKAIYTPIWVTDRLTQVDQAEDSPDEEARNAVHESARILLLQMVEQALNTFQALERYIIAVFPSELHKPQIEAAGGNYYPLASDSDFDACQQMLNSALIYVTQNETTLVNGGLNMPAVFKMNLQTELANFQAKHTGFLNSEAASEAQTEIKIELNNAVYEQIISTINGDGQVIFNAESEESINRQFVLEHQLYLVRGAGVAGIRLHVTNAATGDDVEAATFSIPSRNIELQTNATGRAIQLQLAAASYGVKVTKSGYNEFATTVTVETGTVKRLNVSLVPL